MMMQALVRHYEHLTMLEKLNEPGWQKAGVSFALRLDESGELRAIESLKEEVRGKKSVWVPLFMRVPEQVKRSSGVSANFLCDNAAYMLGIDSKGKPDRAQSCFRACAALHREILAEVNSPIAQAILGFFDTWDPGCAAEHPLVKPLVKEMNAANFVFKVGFEYAQNDAAIQAAWQKRYDDVPEDAQKSRCLVTGELTEIARLHPAIKGVQGAQTMGASLISFNAPAFESYAHDGEQGMNAPVGKWAAFAYGAALNDLISDKEHRIHLGDTTVVFWAEEPEEPCADVFAALMGADNAISGRELLDVMRKLEIGQAINWEGMPVHPDNRFYVLGLAPNAARLSVRFFLQDRFGEMVKRLAEHHERMEIVRPAYDPWPTLPIFAMLKETVNPNASNPDASPQMAGDVLRAILTGGKYPATLFNQVQMRIRAEHEVSRGKAAIIKAYLIQNAPEGEMKKIISEVAQVKLNEETRYAPYVLGRLFAVLEELQEKANPGINTTIRDRYFNSACCTPAVVFPILIRLAQAHIKKLEGGQSVYMHKKIQGLMGMLDEAYPSRLNLNDQGIFQLGYYHEKQKRYEKKEDNGNV
ncbi:MAG: type I-C CRISPR-associated protein Cas8c/Csd1 [Clostridia bacterium]|nr:type I-C CRISPR-associated protein Cas8c/Csd1 [Clostridia bacterium]